MIKTVTINWKDRGMNDVTVDMRPSTNYPNIRTVVGVHRAGKTTLVESIEKYVKGTKEAGTNIQITDENGQPVPPADIQVLRLNYYKWQARGREFAHWEGEPVLESSGVNILEYLQYQYALDVKAAKEQGYYSNPDTMVLGHVNGIVESVEHFTGKHRVPLLRVMDDELAINLDLDEGSFYLLCFFAIIYSRNIPKILVIDNLETGLEYAASSTLVSTFVEQVYGHNRQRLGEEGAGDPDRYPNINQVILTTHCPSLMDGVDIASIILARNEDGVITYTYPADNPSIVEWGKSFLPGQLYTSSQLSRKLHEN